MILHKWAVFLCATSSDPVGTVLRLLAGGLTEPDIFREYPDLEQEDVRECLRFAVREGKLHEEYFWNSQLPGARYDTRASRARGRCAVPAELVIN